MVNNSYPWLLTVTKKAVSRYSRFSARSSRRNMVVILRHSLYSLFLLPFGLRSVTSFCLIYQLQRPSQNRTCGSPAYGSLASLTCYAYRFIETMRNIWLRQRVSSEIFSKPFPVERLLLTSFVQVFILNPYEQS